MPLVLAGEEANQSHTQGCAFTTLCFSDNGLIVVLVLYFNNKDVCYMSRWLMELIDYMLRAALRAVLLRRWGFFFFLIAYSCVSIIL